MFQFVIDGTCISSYNYNLINNYIKKNIKIIKFLANKAK